MSTIKTNDLTGRIAWRVGRIMGGVGVAAEQAATAAEVTETIDTIVVTATKREENIQDVPVAISAFSEEALRDRNIQQARDLAAPNFVFPQMYTTSRS